MKVKLKDNIFIKGRSKSIQITRLEMIHSLSGDQILYVGKTSEIPEEIAKKCAVWDDYSDDISPIYKGCYRDYSNFDANEEIIDYRKSVGFNTAKESIQSACSEEYCIIYCNK